MIGDVDGVLCRLEVGLKHAPSLGGTVAQGGGQLYPTLSVSRVTTAAVPSSAPAHAFANDRQLLLTETQRTGTHS